MSATYQVCNILMRVALRTFGRWQVDGRESVPPYGPLIVVANHLSYLDPPLLMASLPRRLLFLAKQELFQFLPLRLFLRSYGAYPINRSGPDLKAIQWALRVLERDQVLVVFPEGSRSPRGLKKGEPGVAFLALKSQAPILPVAVTGTEDLQGMWQVAFPRGDFRVRIGQPFSLPPVQGSLDRAQMNTLTDLIMCRVALLLPERYRGVYRSACAGSSDMLGKSPPSPSS